LFTSQELLTQLEPSFPSSDQALRFFESDRESLNALSHVAQRAALFAGEAGRGARDIAVTAAAGGVAGKVGLGASVGSVADSISARCDPSGRSAEGDELPQRFSQEMLENYTFVTEFCRHFYSVIGREGPHAPLPDTPAAEKVSKIIARLGEYAEALLQKKNALHAAETRAAGAMVSGVKITSASLAVINELLKLISRAQKKWDTYRGAGRD
jgi:hypothetical protein